MNVNFQLLPEAVKTARLQAKPEVLTRIAEIFADIYGIDAERALDGFEEREALGSTGFGRGVAIPHARSDEVKRPSVVLLRLETPVDFDAADGMPVDLVFGMLSPENAGATHLHALAALSRTVRDDSIHDALMEAPDSEAIYALLCNQFERDAA
ncbi:PTS sugar transporter subunit IIA [Altererythrobacter sp.]|uniref:PTS sugar transporter subunit IIA n=1 Tax=Altererythrobacter sp. TaxID=1872480 RepID=UPI003CFF5128